MNAQIKEIYSIDIDKPLEKYFPENLQNFGLSVRLIIGPEHSEIAESFDLFVCTAQWLDDNCKEEKSIWGRHMLIVFEYNFFLIKKAIEKYLRSCASNEWIEVAKKINKIAAWEFEDYQA